MASKSRAACTMASLAGCALLAQAAGAADILVSMLTDVELGEVSPTTGELLASSEFCVSMSERGRYSVVVRGDGPGGEFALVSGPDRVPLGLRFSDRPGRPGAQLEPGVPLTGQRGKKRKRRDCLRHNAALEVRLRAADLEAAGSGRYRGVLTITVAPE